MNMHVPTMSMNTYVHDRALAHVRRAVGIMNNKRRQFGATEEEKEQVARLGATWKINHVSKEDAAADVCPICHGTEGDNWVSLSCCKKPFHANCIATWLRTSSVCPMCREPVANRNDCMIELLSGNTRGWTMEIEVQKGAPIGVMDMFQGTISKCKGRWGLPPNFNLKGKKIIFHQMHNKWLICRIDGAGDDDALEAIDRLKITAKRITANKNVAQLKSELQKVHPRGWYFQFREIMAID